ncbi:hypothetical protein LPMP_170460 [Leishmania panamensis]|uniref:Uncharacterized protein n=1 Tax=Leishmania panamensis TaxID=5679 RepID=A0A088RPB3_LEIPA|nr:hypothetical protein LPMP_170460 [Leishmania panamensis]AIN97084.1 hypothetical protein LPMP_170460 [Leishmania panamensis]
MQLTMPAPEAPQLEDGGASPPPRPPKRSCSSEGNYQHDKSSEDGAQCTNSSDGRPVPPGRAPKVHGKDAVVPKSAAPRPHEHDETLAGFVYAEVDRDRDGGASEACATTSVDHKAMLTTVELFDATSMTLSLSVDRAAGTERLMAMADTKSPRRRDDRTGDDDVWDRGLNKSSEVAKVAAEVTHTTTQFGLDRATRCSVHSSNAVHVGTTTAAEEEDEESDDEDEDGFFQETVLLMNNNFQSLGSTRCTPAKASHQPSEETLVGSASPTPHMPRSLEVTPLTKPPTGREMPGEGGFTGRPGRMEPGTAFSESKTYLAADTPASPCFTAPVSPATTVNTQAPPAVPASLLSTPQHCCRPDPCASLFAASTPPATAEMSSAASEYFFIDNHDGTAYLADASLQLDGSYALGQTILLAQSAGSSEASSISAVRRNATGIESPVAKPQLTINLPQQRGNAVHRPPRGACLREVLPASVAPPFCPGSPAPHPIQSGAALPVSPSIARVVCRSAAMSRDVSACPVAPAVASRLLSSSFSDSFCFDQTLLVPLDESTLDRSAVIADASVVADRSHRSTAPTRWEACVSPSVVTPVLSLPVVSFRAFQAGTGRRECGVPRPSLSCPTASFSLSRGSPVPDAPIAAEQLAAQQARAAREGRAPRSDQDVIYLIPAGAATATMRPEEITGQGWIPVQAVDVLPSATFAAPPAVGNDVRSHRGIVRGGTESPLPTNPTVTSAAGRVTSQDDCVEESDREPSLSRRSCGGHDDIALPIFSPASTLSASTLECINRRLSYSMSRWASTRQRFGATSQSGADGTNITNLAGSIVLPPATPLFLVGPSQDGHHNTGGTFSAFSAEPVSDSRSPVPVPPESPEMPQREESPSRCTAVATPAASCQQGHLDGAPVAEEDDTGNAANVGWNSLLTSMSYQRVSTVGATTSESYANDGSLSIPLTLSASASLRMGVQRPGAARRCAGGAAAGPAALHHSLQQTSYQFRAPHPRRMSAAGFSHGTASSLSMHAFADHSLQMPTGMALTFSNAAGAAGNSSFRTTYCCNRTSTASTETVSLNPGLGGGDGPGSSSVSAVGLPLSRGALPHHNPHHQHRYSQEGAGGMTRIHSTGSLQAERVTREAAAMNASGAAPHSRAVNRNSALHRRRYASPQQQQCLRWTETMGRVGTGATMAGGRCAAASPACLVPDTSVFLPWAPLTITPEGSVNLGGCEETRCRGGAAAATGAPASCVPMTLMPFTSSAETSTMTTSTTATTITARDAAFSSETLRTLNTAVAAAMEGTVNEFQAYVYAASTTAEAEADTQALDVASPVPSAPSSPRAPKKDGDAQKENDAASFRSTFDPARDAFAAGSVWRSKSSVATRPLGCWEGSAANMEVPLSSKARSPSLPVHPEDVSLPGQ